MEHSNKNMANIEKKAIKQINSFLNRTANSISRNISKGKKTVSRLLSMINNAIS